jgi:hypothetical protein
MTCRDLQRIGILAPIHWVQEQKDNFLQANGYCGLKSLDMRVQQNPYLIAGS